MYLSHTPEPQAGSRQDHPMETDRFEILADQGDICELPGSCQSCQLLLKRGQRALLSADLVVLHHPQSLLHYCRIKGPLSAGLCDNRDSSVLTEKGKFSSTLSASHYFLAKKMRPKPNLTNDNDYNGEND